MRGIKIIQRVLLLVPNPYAGNMYSDTNVQGIHLNLKTDHKSLN